MAKMILRNLMARNLVWLHPVGTNEPEFNEYYYDDAIKVSIDMEALEEWCRVRGIPIRDETHERGGFKGSDEMWVVNLRNPDQAFEFKMRWL